MIKRPGESVEVVAMAVSSGSMAVESVRVMGRGAGDAVLAAGIVAGAGALLEDDKASADGEDDAATAALAGPLAGFVFSSLVLETGNEESKGDEVRIGSSTPAPPAAVFESSRSVISMFLSFDKLFVSIKGLVIERVFCVCVSCLAPVNGVVDAIGRLEFGGDARLWGLPPPIDRCFCNGFVTIALSHQRIRNARRVSCPCFLQRIKLEGVIWN